MAKAKRKVINILLTEDEYQSIYNEMVEYIYQERPERIPTMSGYCKVKVLSKAVTIELAKGNKITYQDDEVDTVEDSSGVDPVEDEEDIAM